MKYGNLALAASVFCCALVAQAVTVDGHVFLSGQTDHRGTSIRFWASSPSAVTDSTTSDSLGGFWAELQPGVYDVDWVHEGFSSYSLFDQLLLFDTTLPDVTLMPPLSGSLSGTLGPGEFEVVDTITVELGQTLEILPGTRLLFRPRMQMIVQGHLQAIGVLGDSIVFTKRYPSPDSTWSGVIVDDGANGSRMEFCVVEFAGVMSTYNYTSGIVFRVSEAVLSQSAVRACRSYYGGGVACYGGSPTIVECVIAGNEGSYGGGVSLLGTRATIHACAISANQAYMGGGLYIDRGAPTIDSTEIVGNRASNGGGVCAGDSTSLQMTGCLLGDNTATYDMGGAIYCSASAQLSLSFCRLIANRANEGSAVYSGGAATCLTRCTIVWNRSYYSSYSSAVEGSAGLILNSCIVAYTVGGWGLDVAQGAQVIYCAISGNDSGAVHADGGPPGLGIVALTNANGDSCDTYYNIFLDPQFADTANGDYHLTAGSPCIDAGDPALEFDADNTVADMGAFYFDQLAISGPERTAVRHYVLGQNYPNPFNSETRIRFDLPRASRVRLAVYDITGRQAAELESGVLPAGHHERMFSGRSLPSGVYFCRLEYDGRSATRKMVLLK
jgi:hypothetical protein